MEYITKAIGPIVAETRVRELDSTNQASFLFMSDIHWDAVACNRKLLKRHLDEAKRRKIPVIIVGDIFDAMQGKWDPRRSMDELRPEFRRDDYFDFVVNEAVKWFKPWADIIHIASYGNHETSIVRHNNTDLLERWVYGMRREHDSPVVKGGYGTWHMIRFDDKRGKAKKTIIGCYHHGKGGGAPVTVGAIETARQAEYLDGVDLVVNGHNHQGYIIARARKFLTSRGQVQKGVTLFLRTPGYKDGLNALMGFDVEKGSPKPTGSIMVHFGLHGDGSYHKRFEMRAETMIV